MQIIKMPYFCSFKAHPPDIKQSPAKILAPHLNKPVSTMRSNVPAAVNLSETSFPGSLMADSKSEPNKTVIAAPIKNTIMYHLKSGPFRLHKMGGKAQKLGLAVQGFILYLSKFSLLSLRWSNKTY